MGSAALAEAAKSIRDWSLENRTAAAPAVRAVDMFGSLVFTDEVQQERLPKPAYCALRATITHGEPLDLATADAVRVLKLFGSNAERVFATCGQKQEYCLIDRNFSFARSDLINTGLTLFGARRPRGQKMQDQYFGSIPEQVLAFMSEVELELCNVGVPVKTRHNKVAPRASTRSRRSSRTSISPSPDDDDGDAREAVDRNRTSLFAFTGNKFEFRAVSSGQNISFPNTALNVAMADALDQVATELEQATAAGEELKTAVGKLLTNNSSAQWEKEAKRRGLLNLKNTVDALPELEKPAVVPLFERYKVLNERERHARYEVFLENYSKTINVEGQLMVLMANRYILPAALEYQKQISQRVTAVRAGGGRSV